MQVVLWDRVDRRIVKDAAGGFGVAENPWPGRMVTWPWERIRRPAPLLYGSLAAMFRQLGWTVRYVANRTPRSADLYVFRPSFPTLHAERRMMATIARREPDARILVVGRVATELPEIFADLPVTVIKGDAEQLRWTLDDVLRRPGATIQLGSLDDLDALPTPDWTPFDPWKSKLAEEFWRFPTAAVEVARGCSESCAYCPERSGDRERRRRSPHRVAQEIQLQINRWGFFSFKLHDPNFGDNVDYAFDLAGELAHILQDFQFSIETRVEYMSPPMLRALRQVGLRCVTVGVESPDRDRLVDLGRRVASPKQYAEFFATCHRLGLRTIGEFLIGFPDETEDSIARTLEFATTLQPTFAKFRFLTPYPGVEYFAKQRQHLTNFQYVNYTTQTPVLSCERLSSSTLRRRLTMCHRRYYLQRNYLLRKAMLLWPALANWLLTPESNDESPPPESTVGADHAVSGMHKRAKQPDARFVRRDKPHVTLHEEGDALEHPPEDD